MINNIHIRNYKALKDLSIEHLRRFNLFFGMNNAGKSSLLEALYLLATAVDPLTIKKIMSLRGYSMPLADNIVIEATLEQFASLYAGRSVEDFYREPISIEWDNKILQLKYVNLKFEDKIDATNGDTVRVRKIEEFESSDLAVSIGEVPAMMARINDTHLYVSDFRKLVQQRTPLTRPNFTSRFLRTSQITSQDNSSLFDKITMTPLEQELIRALQIIEPRIEAINFLKNDSFNNRIDKDDRVPYVVFRGSTQRYRLSSMGDGINRILTIILSLLNCRDGMLMIDEFENGLHYSVQKELWTVIMSLAENLNIQVFASTHSDDCIKGFVKSEAYQNGLAVRLETVDDQIIPVEFNKAERLQFAVSNNHELR